MELLLSNKFPARFPKTSSSNDIFLRYLRDSDSITMATGYISADSLIELNKTIEINHKPKIELMIGMHYFEGFTRSQFDAALSLNKALISKALGGVFISNTSRFHGKVYYFEGKSISPAIMLGSSNLDSCLSKNPMNYETDILITERNEVYKYNTYLKSLIASLSVPLASVTIESFVEKISLLENHYGVNKVDPMELAEVKRSLTGVVFKLPIKTETKSNINAFFGKGRVNKKGFVIPRPWYEVELIVSNSMTQHKNFPYCMEFDVITDDGWRFKCKTSGDFAKNFRSNDDLKILGKWIKGRLENANCLKIGELVSDQVLSSYGRNTIDLVKTEIDNLWYLNFNV